MLELPLMFPQYGLLEFSDLRPEEILFLTKFAASLKRLNFVYRKHSVFKNTILCSYSMKRKTGPWDSSQKEIRMSQYEIRLKQEP